MEHQIDNLFSKVNNLNNNFTEFETEFIDISESVLNKTIYQFNLEQLTKHKEKLENLNQKIQQFSEDSIEIEQSGRDIKNSYSKFEQAVFDQKMQDTKQIVKETNNLIDKI